MPSSHRGASLYRSPGPLEWLDGMTGCPSQSLGEHERLLREAGLTWVADTQDEGGNHYYFAERWPGRILLAVTLDQTEASRIVASGEGDNGQGGLKPRPSGLSAEGRHLHRSAHLAVDGLTGFSTATFEGFKAHRPPARRR